MLLWGVARPTASDDGSHARSAWRAARCPLLITFWVGLATFACTRAPDPAVSRASTVVVAYCCGPQALNPSMGQTSQFLLFLPLIARDDNGELVGRLAHSWERSEDHREWTYHLRTDVRWHDGVPVTAHDVAFTLNLLMHPDVGYYPAGTVSPAVIDDSTVVVRYAGIPQDWWTVYYPRHLLEELDPAAFYEWEFWRRPVGNGPYRFLRYVPETMMEFEANPDHYRGEPSIERVVLKFGGTAVTELLSGAVDAAEVDHAGLPRLAADPRFRFYHATSGAARAIYWKNDHPLFTDARVRRALTLAIDRRELLVALSLPESTPLVDGVHTERQLRRHQLPDPLPHDPAEARRLLEAAGWHAPGTGDVRTRDGRELRFTALVDAATGGARLAELVQAQLREVGVRMEVQPLETAVVQERVASGAFEAAISLVVAVPAMLRMTFAEGSPLAYENPRMTALIERATETADPEKLDEVYLEIAEILRADQPVTFLHWLVFTTVAHRRLQGLSSPWKADPVMFMEELWIERDPG
jgi:peptide/nickel transport system substrate-binding protein